MIYHTHERKTLWKLARGGRIGAIKCPTIEAVPPPCAELFLRHLEWGYQLERDVDDEEGRASIISTVGMVAPWALADLCSFQHAQQGTHQAFFLRALSCCTSFSRRFRSIISSYSSWLMVPSASMASIIACFCFSISAIVISFSSPFDAILTGREGSPGAAVRSRAGQPRPEVRSTPVAA